MSLPFSSDDCIGENKNDWICIPLAEMLQQEGKLSLTQIAKKAGLTRQTTHNHLKHLVKAGILTREAKKQGRGRPTILYKRTKIPINTLKMDSVVTLTFKNLKHACRYRNSSFCTKTERNCNSWCCPLTYK